MTCDTQRDAQGRIEHAFLRAFASHKFIPELTEGNFVMVSMQVYAVCIAFLAGKIISSEYGIAPSDVQLGLSQYLLLFGFAMLPVVGFLASSLACSFRLGNQEFSRSGIVERQMFRYADGLRVHVRANGDRHATPTLAEMLALIFRNPKVHTPVISAAVISGIWTILDVPRHVTHYIKFNEDLPANRMNCGKPDRVTPRAIRSQAGSTLSEGSETTGAVESA